VAEIWQNLDVNLAQGPRKWKGPSEVVENFDAVTLLLKKSEEVLPLGQLPWKATSARSDLKLTAVAIAASKSALTMKPRAIAAMLKTKLTIIKSFPKISLSIRFDDRRQSFAVQCFSLIEAAKLTLSELMRR
jgi:hypothetical protein